MSGQPLSPAEDVLRREAERDFFEHAGIEVPSYLKTYFRRWAALLIVAVSGAFASGPFVMWPTLEPILISEGVWAGPQQQANLTSVYSIATGLSMISSLLAGIFYDARGPRDIGAAGAFGCALALVAMAAAIKIPSLNNLLFIAYPAATIFGWANTMDTYAWLWLLPGEENTVAAVAGAIQCLSDSACLVAVILHNEYGIQLSSYFLGTAALSILAGFLALALVPGQEEMVRIANAVTQYHSAKDVPSQDYGATDNLRIDADSDLKVPLEGSACLNSMRKSWLAIKDTSMICCYIHPCIISLFISYSIAEYMFAAYPSFVMYPLYVDLMGTARAVHLVDIFGGIYACVSSVSLVCFGKVVDRIGLAQAIAWINLPILLNTCLYAVPTMGAQVTAQVLLAFFINVSYVFIPRFSMLYAPAELFGTMWGVLNAVQGAAQMLLTRYAIRAIRLLVLYLFSGRAGPAIPFLATIDLWSFLSVLTSLALLLWWWYFPLPRQGSTTMAHVRNAGHDAGERLAMWSDKESVASQPLQKHPSMPQAGTKSLSGSCCGCLQGFVKQSEPGSVASMP